MATPSPAFPAAVATDAQLKVANNLIQTTLAVGINAGNTILFVNSAAGFLANCLISVDNEIIAISAVIPSPNAQLVVAPGGRGFDGTAAGSHSAGAKISMLIDAWHHNALATEIKAIESFLGPNGQNLVIGAHGIYYASDYNFTPQQPGGALIVGSNVITLAPVPPGVNATDLNHWLYISNGTGAPEAVKITGGAAVAGAASGTIIVTCANTHSGAWTISSATGGVAEAQQALLASGSPGTINIFAPATFHAGVYGSTPSATINVTFRGSGQAIANVVRAADYPNGDLFHTTSTIWTFEDITMSNGAAWTGGASIWSSQTLNIFNVQVFDGHIGVQISGQATIRDLTYVQTYYATEPLAALEIDFSGNVLITGLNIQGSQQNNANVMSFGVYINGCDTVAISNSNLSSAKIAFFTDSTNHYVANLSVSNTIIIDNWGGIFMIGTANAATNINFENVLIQGDNPLGNTSGIGSGNGIRLGFGAGGDLLGSNISFTGVHVTNFYASGIWLQVTAGGTGLSFTGCQVWGNNTGNVAGENGIRSASAYTINNLSMSGCQVFGNNGFGLQFYGTNNSATFVGNRFYSNTGGSIGLNTGFTGILGPNSGMDDVIAAVPSAAALTLPAGKLFNLTGGTGVTSIATQNPAGFVWNFTVDASTAFTAGTGIGNTITITKFGQIYWNGSKAWISGV